VEAPIAKVRTYSIAAPQPSINGLREEVMKPGNRPAGVDRIT